MTAVRTETEFRHTRDVPTEWERSLAEIAPRSDRVPWLKLVWHAGMPYQPTQRWVIYEMNPNLDIEHVVVDARTGKKEPNHVLSALYGPKPRQYGEWVWDESIPAEHGHKRWESHSLVSQLQWDLFRKTKCVPRLFWVIQGAGGGHKWRLSAIEKNYLQSVFGEQAALADVPNPGDLPYAEWSNMVALQVKRLDRLRKWDEQTGKSFDQRTANRTEAGLIVARETWNEEQEYAKLVNAYMFAQIEDSISNASDACIRRLWDNAKPGDTHYNAGQDELEQRLIEDTTHAPRPEGD